MLKATTGAQVKIHYVGTYNDGSEFDSSYERGVPIDIQVGSTKLIKGFSDAILGMIKGETKNFSLAPNEAYGDVNPSAFAEVPRSNFPEDFNFETGGMIQGVHPTGQRMIGTISEITDDLVVVDMNHPMAGKELNFKIELLEINNSTESKKTPVAKTPVEETPAAEE
tara:strand:- start:2127 stop:2627 length:501 start_codon:yes stop_codon:yes gene_type:complete